MLEKNATGGVENTGSDSVAGDVAESSPASFSSPPSPPGSVTYPGARPLPPPASGEGGKERMRPAGWREGSRLEGGLPIGGPAGPGQDGSSQLVNVLLASCGVGLQCRQVCSPCFGKVFGLNWHCFGTALGKRPCRGAGGTHFPTDHSTGSHVGPPCHRSRLHRPGPAGFRPGRSRPGRSGPPTWQVFPAR